MRFTANQRLLRIIPKIALGLIRFSTKSHYFFLLLLVKEQRKTGTLSIMSRNCEMKITKLARGKEIIVSQIARKFLLLSFFFFFSQIIFKENKKKKK